MIYVGTTNASKVYLGTTQVSKVYLGSTQVFPAGLTAMGMDKSGTYSAPFGQTTKMTGWVERSGFSGSVITNNELVVNGNGNITVYLFGDRTQYANTGDQFHIYKNGVTVANTGNLNFNPDGSCQWTGAVVSGDTFAFYVKNASAFSNFTMQTGSYLYYVIN